MIEKLPRCHPILTVVTHSDSCLSLILGRGIKHVTRDQGFIFLQRTADKTTFECPVRIFGRCNDIFKCIPEPENITVIDSVDMNPNNMTRYLKK